VARLEGEVRVRVHMRQEMVAAANFFGRVSERGDVWLVKRAGKQQCAARAAVAGLAAVRQVERGAERGLQDRLFRRDAQRAPVRLDAYAVFLRAQVSRSSSDRTAAASPGETRLDAPGRAGQGA